MLSLFVLMMPTILLSGFIFPTQQHALALQVVSNVMPAKHFIIILRGIMLKGVGSTCCGRKRWSCHRHVRSLCWPASRNSKCACNEGRSPPAAQGVPADLQEQGHAADHLRRAPGATAGAGPCGGLRGAQRAPDS
jgi:hypothetical protein